MIGWWLTDGEGFSPRVVQRGILNPEPTGAKRREPGGHRWGNPEPPDKSHREPRSVQTNDRSPGRPRTTPDRTGDYISIE